MAEKETTKTYECESCGEAFVTTGKPHKLDEAIVCNECYEEAVREAKLEGGNEDNEDNEDIDYDDDEEEE